MTADNDFLAIEIDALDEKLSDTAVRKRIPSLMLAPPLQAGKHGKSELPAPEPAHRPEVVKEAVRRRPLSLEVPDYLARELKVKAATEAVTVRFLVLSALAEAGYRVDGDELAEDGRRLR